MFKFKQLQQCDEDVNVNHPNHPIMLCAVIIKKLFDIIYWMFVTCFEDIEQGWLKQKKFTHFERFMEEIIFVVPKAQKDQNKVGENRSGNFQYWYH